MCLVGFWADAFLEIEITYSFLFSLQSIYNYRAIISVPEVCQFAGILDILSSFMKNLFLSIYPLIVIIPGQYALS